MSDTKKRSKPTKIPRHFVPGVPVAAVPGAALEVAVLGEDDGELFGVDLASGAFVRIDPVSAFPHDHFEVQLEDGKSGVIPDNGLDQNDPAHSDTDHSDTDREGSGRTLRRSIAPYLVRLVVGEDEPMDPGRPETIWPIEQPHSIGAIRPRQLRRLLGEIVAEEQPHGLVLGSRAASVSYADIDPDSPSMVLIGIRPKRCELLTTDRREVTLTFTWSGLRQTLEVRDPRAQSAARAHAGRRLVGDTLTRTLGFKVRYALVGFAPVANGYVRKVVIRLLGN